MLLGAFELTSLISHSSLIAISVALALSIPACTNGLHFGQFAEFRTYERESGFVRLPVIFVPGIKGSRLFVVDEAGKERKELWGTSGEVTVLSDFDDLRVSLLDKMDEPGTPGESYPSPEFYKRSGVRADYLPYYRLGFSKSWTLSKVDIYESLIDFLSAPNEGGYNIDKNLFVFAYDWRLDNRLAAVRLSLDLAEYRKKYMDFIVDSFCKSENISPCDGEHSRFREYWQKIQKHPRNARFFRSDGQIKFQLIAHSMGGLVARYFVWGMGRSEDVNRLIVIGTPNLGTIDALKGFNDGEYPESIQTYLSKWLPFSAYSETDTKPILFSFSSIFQLLPRNSRSVEKLELKEMGLALNLSLKEFESMTANRYYEKYEQLSLLPSVRSMRRYLKGIDPTDIGAKIREHLYANLRSAFCFHRSIGFEVVKEEPGAVNIVKECQEEERIRVAERFVKYVEPRLANTALPTANRNGAPDLIIFSGHCHPTYYRAQLVGNQLHYLKAPEGGDKSQGNENESLEYEYGDGRVPVWSAGWERPVGGISPGYTFFLCEDHVGLVKNQSFRYNLLRELLVIRSAVPFD